MTNIVTSTPNSIKFVILGEPASKANSRIHVMWGDRPGSIKSKKARAYCDVFREQCPKLEFPLQGDVEVIMTIWYASRRPDLDESVILDLMQTHKKKGVVINKYIYENDRQVKLKTVRWGLSPTNPRLEVEVLPYEVPAYLLEIEPKAKKKASKNTKLAA